MTHFTLEGNRDALEPLAAQLELDMVWTDGKDARWRKSYPKSRRRSRRLTPDLWTGNGSPCAMRPFDRGGSNDKRKAIEYAMWLAKRDGVIGADPNKAEVFFDRVYLSKPGSYTLQARSVQLGPRSIDIPHFGYDPTKPIIEELEL